MLKLEKGKTTSVNNFNYIKMSDCFEKEVYIKLNESFPKLEELVKTIGYDGLKFSNGNRFDMDFSFLMKHKTILSVEWLTFLQYIACESFFRESCKYLGINDEEYKTFSYRGDDVHSDIKIDFQICYNIKNNNNESGFLRSHHVDCSDKLVVVLLYFPYLLSEYNESDKGELNLYNTKLEKIDEVRYMHNHGIIFRNSEDSIHAPSRLLNHPDENRRFVNVVFIDNRMNR